MHYRVTARCISGSDLTVALKKSDPLAVREGPKVAGIHGDRVIEVTEHLGIPAHLIAVEPRSVAQAICFALTKPSLLAGSLGLLLGGDALNDCTLFLAILGPM